MPTIVWRHLTPACWSSRASRSCVGLGRSAISDSDEAFYAEAAREMVESGDWLTPHYNYEDRFQKPILYYWLAAAAFVVDRSGRGGGAAPAGALRRSCSCCDMGRAAGAGTASAPAVSPA